MSKLLSGIAIPAALALSTLTAVAQETPPPPSAPAEKMVEPTTPSDSSPSETMVKPSAPAPTAAAPSAAAPGSYAAEQTADEWRSSKLVGLNVYNEANEKIGDINDLILASDGKINSAVIGVGGFLGMGEKLVAVPFSDLKFGRDANGNIRVSLSSSKEALEKAPDFKYAEKRS